MESALILSATDWYPPIKMIMANISLQSIIYIMSAGRNLQLDIHRILILRVAVPKFKGTLSVSKF